MTFTQVDSFTYFIIKCIQYCKKVLKKLKLPLSKAIIEKLSIADAQTVSQFLTNLKTMVDKFEQDKELELENSQHFPFYIVENGDMIQVSGT